MNEGRGTALEGKGGAVKNSPDHVRFSRESFEMTDARRRANELGRASFTENKTVESWLSHFK